MKKFIQYLNNDIILEAKNSFFRISLEDFKNILKKMKHIIEHPSLNQEDLEKSIIKPFRNKEFRERFISRRKGITFFKNWKEVIYSYAENMELDQYIYNIPNLSKKEIIQSLIIYPENIADIKNPDIDIQNAAIDADPEYILTIPFASKITKIRAIKSDPQMIIRFIKNHYEYHENIEKMKDMINIGEKKEEIRNGFQKLIILAIKILPNMKEKIYQAIINSPYNYSRYIGFTKSERSIILNVIKNKMEKERIT